MLKVIFVYKFFPLQKGFTFLATIETIEIVNKTAGFSQSLGTWDVPDKFNADQFRISIQFECHVSDEQGK